MASTDAAALCNALDLSSAVNLSIPIFPVRQTQQEAQHGLCVVKFAIGHNYNHNMVSTFLSMSAIQRSNVTHLSCSESALNAPAAIAYLQSSNGISDVMP